MNDNGSNLQNSLESSLNIAREGLDEVKAKLALLSSDDYDYVCHFTIATFCEYIELVRLLKRSCEVGLRVVLEEIEESLLNNAWRGRSSSVFARAIDQSNREVNASFLRQWKRRMSVIDDFLES